MATAFDRYGEALGFWRLPQERPEDDPIDIKLKMGDGRKLRDILMNERNKKEKAFLFDQFEGFMFGIIKRDYPQLKDEQIKGFIEMNVMELFDSAQITFRYTTAADLKKAKEDMLKDIKKSIGDN